MHLYYIFGLQRGNRKFLGSLPLTNSIMSNYERKSKKVYVSLNVTVVTSIIPFVLMNQNYDISELRVYNC